MKASLFFLLFTLLYSNNSFSLEKQCESSKSIEFMVNRISTGLTCSSKQEPGLCSDMINSTNQAYTANVGAVVAAGYPGNFRKKYSINFNFFDFVFNKAYAVFNNGVISTQESIKRDIERKQIKKQLTGRITYAQKQELLSRLGTLESKLNYAETSRIRNSINTYQKSVDTELNNELEELNKTKKDLKASKPTSPELSDKFKADKQTLRNALTRQPAYDFIEDAKLVSKYEISLNPDYLDSDGKPLDEKVLRTYEESHKGKSNMLEKTIKSHDPNTQKVMRDIVSEQRIASTKFVADTKSYFSDSKVKLNEIGKREKSIQIAKDFMKPFATENLSSMDTDELRVSAKGLSSMTILDNPAIEKSRLYLKQNAGLIIDTSDRWLSKVGEVAFKRFARIAGKGIALRAGAFVASGGFSTFANAAEGAALTYDAGSYGVTKLRAKYDSDCQSTNKYQVMKDCEPFAGLTPQFMSYLALEDPNERLGAMDANLCKTLIAIYDTYKPDSIELVSCHPNNKNFKIYDPQLDDEFEVYIKDEKITRLVGGAEHAATNYAIDFNPDSEQASKLYTMNNNVFTKIDLKNPSSFRAYNAEKIMKFKAQKKSTRTSRRKSIGNSNRKNVISSAYKMTAGLSELAICCNGSQKNFDSKMCKRYQKEKFKENSSTLDSSPTKSAQ